MPSLKLTIVLLVFALLALAGCAAATTPAAPTPEAAAPTVEPTAVAPAAEPAVAAPAEAPTASAPTEEPTAVGSDSPLPTPTATPEPEAEPTGAPAEALSLGQALAAAFPATPTAAGEVILVTGQVLDLAGAPLPGAAVEFWQTDANGVYDHPGDPGAEGRDRGFQFYGTSIADAAGRYVFRTVQPGYYEPRPRHIHVKVKMDGRELLTTQFYFEEDRAGLGGEGVFAQAGGLGDLLILQAVDSVETADGATLSVLTNDLILDTGSPGALTATPAQAEGPYYPAARVADYDNDLAAVP